MVNQPIRNSERIIIYVFYSPYSLLIVDTRGRRKKYENTEKRKVLIVRLSVCSYFKFFTYVSRESPIVCQTILKSKVIVSKSSLDELRCLNSIKVTL